MTKRAIRIEGNLDRCEEKIRWARNHFDPKKNVSGPCDKRASWQIGERKMCFNHASAIALEILAAEDEATQ